jgi:ferredoxin-fold anticodon binding domain-containing protein
MVNFVLRLFCNVIFIYINVIHFLYVRNHYRPSRKNPQRQKPPTQNHVSETVRIALEDEIRRIENAELSNAISEMKLVLEKIPDAEIISTIHDSRDPR